MPSTLRHTLMAAATPRNENALSDVDDSAGHCCAPAQKQLRNARHKHHVEKLSIGGTQIQIGRMRTAA